MTSESAKGASATPKPAPAATIGVYELRDAAIITGPQGRWGVLHPNYTGLTLNIGTTRFPSALDLWETLMRTAPAGAVPTTTWTLRLWTLKILTMQHPRPVALRLTETAAATIVLDAQPPWGMIRQTGTRTGENWLGQAWSAVREALHRRAGAAVRAIRSPETSAIVIGGKHIAVVRADGAMREAQQDTGKHKGTTP